MLRIAYASTANPECPYKYIYIYIYIVYVFILFMFIFMFMSVFLLIPIFTCIFIFFVYIYICYVYVYIHHHVGIQPPKTILIMVSGGPTLCQNSSMDGPSWLQEPYTCVKSCPKP